jgi:hypothetical protein
MWHSLNFSLLKHSCSWPILIRPLGLWTQAVCLALWELFQILSVLVIFVNCYNVCVFYICIFSNKLDLFEVTSFIIMTFSITTFSIMIVNLNKFRCTVFKGRRQSLTLPLMSNLKIEDQSLLMETLEARRKNRNILGPEFQL